jgi:hypothetical protein
MTGMDMKHLIDVGTAVVELVKNPVVVGGVSGFLGSLTPVGKAMLGLANNELDMVLGLPQRQRMLERASEAFIKAQQMAAARGLTISPAGLKFLVPWFEATAMEENESIHEMWASLLANRVLPGGENLPYGFVSILRKMSPIEAHLLKWLHEECQRINADHRQRGGLIVHDEPAIDPYLVERDHSVDGEVPPSVWVGLECLQASRLVAVKSDVKVSVEDQWDHKMTHQPYIATGYVEEGGYQITVLGHAFIEACQPPKTK